MSDDTTIDPVETPVVPAHEAPEVEAPEEAMPATEEATPAE